MYIEIIKTVHNIVIRKLLNLSMGMEKNKFAIVDMKGGFGNQLFQLCFANYLNSYNIDTYINSRNFERSKKIKNLDVDLRELILPIEFFGMKEINNTKFMILEIIQKISRNVMVKKFNDKNFEINKLKRINRLDGYWQNLDYFKFSKDYLISTLSNNNKLKNAIYSKKVEGSTMVHVRRGDYLRLGEELDIRYYEKSINNARENIDKFSFSVFTDDKRWVREHKIFDDANNVFFSSNSKSDTLDTFAEMLKFENYIISNSTFSLMASLLSQTVGSLIYIPDPWFRKSEKIINYENTIKIPNSKD